MLQDSLSEQVKTALKAHEEVRLSTLRMLLSALKYARIDKMRDLTAEEELEVVRKEAKKRNDAIETYEKVGAGDRAQSEKAELTILQEFLPKALSKEELEVFVDQSISEVGNNFGDVMKSVMAKAKGAADGKVISDLVRAKLQ